MTAEPLDPEDAKLVVLARSAMARAEARSGAAVRDVDGRTYAAAPVDLSTLQLTALQTAVAGAVSSGAGGLEAAVLVAGSADDAGGHHHRRRRQCPAMTVPVAGSAPNHD
jgi:hypothetical protein